MNRAEIYFQDLTPLSHASGAGSWVGANVAPRRPELCQSFWHDSITLTVLAQLTALFYRTSIESRHVGWCDL
jgi:hypothetical protein